MAIHVDMDAFALCEARLNETPHFSNDNFPFTV